MIVEIMRMDEALSVNKVGYIKMEVGPGSREICFCKTGFVGGTHCCPPVVLRSLDLI